MKKYLIPKIDQERDQQGEKQALCIIRIVAGIPTQAGCGKSRPRPVGRRQRVKRLPLPSLPLPSGDSIRKNPLSLKSPPIQT